MLHTVVVEKIKTHILCLIIPPENFTVYEIRWKNIVELGRPHLTIWCVGIARWVLKATSTHSEYVILFYFPYQHWLHERALLLRYTYIDCLVKF